MASVIYRTSHIFRDKSFLLKILQKVNITKSKYKKYSIFKRVYFECSSRY
jgi:hypothetical protein